jgi:hypothetical protein
VCSDECPGFWHLLAPPRFPHATSSGAALAAGALTMANEATSVVSTVRFIDLPPRVLAARLSKN